MIWEAAHRNRGVSNVAYFTRVLKENERLVMHTTVRNRFFAAVRLDGVCRLLVVDYHWHRKYEHNMVFRVRRFDSLADFGEDVPPLIAAEIPPAAESHFAAAA